MVQGLALLYPVILDSQPELKYGCSCTFKPISPERFPLILNEYQPRV